MFPEFINRTFAVLTDEPSLISELYEYFKEKYFTPEFGDYTHFSIGSGSMLSLQTLLFGLFVGVNLAALLAIFNKRVLGDFVRKLLSEECSSPESAKTLRELGFIKNTAVRGSLRSGVTLRRIVRCVETDEHNRALEEKRREYEAANNPPAHPDAPVSEADDDAPAGEKTVAAPLPGANLPNSSPKKVRGAAFCEIPFKINFDTAHFYIPKELKYTADIKFEKKGTNWLAFFAVLILSVVMMILIIKLLPELLQMLDNFFNIFSDQ